MHILKNLIPIGLSILIFGASLMVWPTEIEGEVSKESQWIAIGLVALNMVWYIWRYNKENRKRKKNRSTGSKG